MSWSSADPPQADSGHVAPAPPDLTMPDMPYKDMTADMGMYDAAALAAVMVDQLEVERACGRTLLTWDGQAWYGGDYDKLWFKSEGSPGADDQPQARNELLWDHIVSRWWNLQAGVRDDLGQGPARGWAAVGIQGLAPYWFDVEATLYAGEAGRTAARFRVEHEVRFTQRLILQPELETDLYGKADPARQIGSGVSDLQAALRLRYEIRREIAPYLGVTWRRDFGATAQFARGSGSEASAVYWVAGLHFWF
jgi:copper resistance protein B